MGTDRRKSCRFDHASGRHNAERYQIDEENIYHWNLALMVLNPDSLYYGGYFKAQMNFPKDYPYKPPGEYIDL